MSRVQLALNVSDIDAAVDFYSRLFGTEPAKRQPGYANFAIAEPPLKLVLIENPAARGERGDGCTQPPGRRGDHTPKRCKRPSERLSGEGLSTEVQESTTCCFAVQDKVWANDPDGAPWEYYTVLADASDEVGLGCSTEGCTPVPWGRGAREGSVTVSVLLTPRDAAQRAPMPEIALWRRLTAEFIGSAFLAAVVVGSGIAAQQLSPGNTGLELLENAAATAAGLFALILMVGPVSGAHFNPVVSFVDAAFGGMTWRSAMAYLAGPGGWMLVRRHGGQPHVLPGGREHLHAPSGQRRPTSSRRWWPHWGSS